MHAWELGGSPGRRICDPAVVHCLHVTVDGEEQGFVYGGEDPRHGDPNKFARRVFTHLVSSLIASCGGSVECMKLLIEGGANVEASGFSGAIPLLLACSHRGNIGFVKCL